MADGVDTNERSLPSTMVADIGDDIGGPVILETGGYPVQDNHVMSGVNSHVHDVRSDEARAAGDKDSHDAMTVAVFTGFSYHSRRTRPRLILAESGFRRQGNSGPEVIDL